MNPVRIGTRSSPLALWQARKVAHLLETSGISTKIIEITSSGDRSVGGDLATSVGQFVHGIDEELLTGKIDVAVHSSKDVPTFETPGISHLAYLERGCTSDVLLSQHTGKSTTLAEVLASNASTTLPDVLASLDRGATIGTVSGRRQSFLLSQRPDLLPLAVRGQVQTRLLRLKQGRVDALVLAEVGLKRLHEDGALEDWMLALSCQRIDESQWPTAPGQGAISVHCATDRFEEMSGFRKVLNHTATEKEVLSEREQLQHLGGGCLFPAGIRSKSGRLNVKVSPKNWRDLHCRGESFHTLDYNGPVDDFVAQAPEQKAEPPLVVNDGRQLISTLNSERLAMRLQSEGIRVVNHPVLDLQPLKGNWPHLNLDTISDRRKWPLLLLTSPFAARCAAEISESIPEYRRIQWVAIGEGTARACFKLGITASICGRARNSKDFATYIREHIEPTNLLLLPQSNRADDSFGEALKQSGFEVQRWIGYENKTKKVDSFSSSKDDVLLLSSPSSALAWVDNSLPIASTILVMGESTKAQLEKMEQFSESNVQVLKGPTADYITQWWNETGEQ